MDIQLELYKSIFDNAVDAIFIGDENGDFIIVNKSAEILTGYTKNELLKLNMSDLFTSHTLANSPLKYSVLDKNEIITKERELKRKDSSLISVEMKSKKLADGLYQSFIRDISERKKKDKEIEENKEQYKVLFELSPTGIVLEDSGGTIIDANPAIHKTFGYRENELIGKNIEELAHPEAKRKTKENIKRILSGEKLKHVVKSIKNDGTEIYNELYETKISLPKIGTGILSISHDITKQVIAEQKLRESENKFRSIIEHSSNMFYTHTADHKLTYVSPQVRDFLDCEPEEAMTKWTDFITDNPINKAGLEKTQRAIDTGIAQVPYELELNTRKGRKLIVEVHETPIVVDGKTTGIVGALINITEKKLLELSYKELFEYSPIPLLEEDVTELFNYYKELESNGITDIRKYLNNNPDAVINCTTKIKPYRINQAGLELYGFKNVEEYKNNFQTIFTPKSLKIFKEQIIAFSKGITTFSAETETVRTTGEKKYLLMKIQLRPQINSARKTELFSLIDITKRKQAEIALNKSKEQLQFAIEGSDVGLWDWNIKSGKTEINEKWAALLGYSIDELEPMTDNKITNLIHPSDFEKKQQAIFNHLKGNTSLYVNEMRMKHKSGSWKWILTRGKVVEWDENNNPVRMAGTNLDITERKLQDFLLKKYANEIESFFYLSQEMIQKLNAEDIISLIPKHIVQALNNAESASMWTYNKSKNIFEVVSCYGYGNRKIESLTLPESGSIIGEIYKNKTTIICNDTAKDPRYKKGANIPELNTKATVGVPLINDNEVIYILFVDNFSGINVFNDDDVKILKSFANISSIAINNVKLYDEIKTSELKFRSIVDSVGESIFIHDIETGQIVDVNNKMLETYGFNYQEALNLNPNESSSGVYPYTAEEALNYVQKAKNEGPQLFEWHARKKNGELFWTEVNLRKMKVGTEDRIVAVVRDITERKQIELEIKESEAKIETVMKSAPVGIGVVNNRVLEYVNDHLLELLGYNREEMLGQESKRFYETIDEFDKIGKLYDQLQIKEIASSETRIKSKNNEIKDIIISLCPIDKTDLSKGIIFSVLDITENKTYQKKLLEEQSRYKSLFEKAPVPLWEEDFTGIYNKIDKLKKEGVTDFRKYLDDNPDLLNEFVELIKVLDVNQAALALHNAKSKKDLLSGLSIIFTEESFNVFKEEIIAISNGEKYFSSESKVKTLDNQLRSVSIKLFTGEYKSNSYGKTYITLLATTDITEKKIIENELKTSEFNLKEAQKIAKIGHWEADLIKNKLYWSDEVYRIFNITRQKFGATYDAFLDNIHPEDKEKVNTAYTLSVKNKTPYEITHRLKPKNGNIKYVREIGKTFYDDNGNPIKSIGTIQDITQIVLAENEKNEQIKKNQVILNTTNDGFILADKKGKIVDVNPAYCKLVGYSENELKSMNINDLEISLTKKEIDARIKRIVAKGYDNFETKHISKDGKIIDLAVSISTTNFKNQVLVAAFVRDITLQNKAISELQQSRKEISKLAQHLQDIREEERHHIATEIHDDLGQSLTALKLDTTILLRKLGNSDKAVTEKLESMKELTDQTIKTVQKISSELRPGILDDLGLAAAIEWETGKFEERTGIKCSLKIIPHNLSINEKLNVIIFRLFQETCTNVARHSKATKLDIIMRKKKNKLTIEIKDNGIGITKDQINGHTSFGIIGMKERLKNIDGKINFVSQPDKGTIVKIEIPFKSEDTK